jgi:hypothetical protein
MPTIAVRVAALAVVASALAWLLAVAAPAVAGTYTVSACTAAKRFGHQTPPTHAFAELSLLPSIQTGGMFMRRACADFDGAPFGMVAGNVVRSGRVSRGHQAGFVMDAPAGTSFVALNWSGKALRRDCRYAIQMYALAADGSVVQVRRPDGTEAGGIRNFPANRNCARKDSRASYLQVQQLGTRSRPKLFGMLGPATRIVQRTVCVGGSRKRFCSARSINRIHTWWAEATVADGSAPSVAIAQDSAFTQGAWVSSGSHSVGYTVSDNVGVKSARAIIGGNQREEQSRPCDYTRTIPCGNDPGHIDVRTTEIAEGTQPLVVRGTDPADNMADSQPVTVRVDRTAPAAPSVSVEGGEGWRSQNSFAALWPNPAEADRAPIAAAHWRICRSGTNNCTTGSQSGVGISRLADLRVPEPGEWELRVVREDAAGNRNDDYASQPVRLRHDPEAPTLSFESAPGDDPTRVSVAVSEKISGIATGQIELSQEGSNTWHTLPTRLEGNRLVARIDDAALPPGRYLLRGQATDLAGNVGVAAAAQPLTLPLRIQSTMQAGVVTTRIVRERAEGKKGRQRTIRRRVTELRPQARVRWGGHVTIAGRLTNRERQPLPGQQIQVLGPGAGGEELLAVLTTDAQGGFSYRAVGSASRTLQFVHTGTALTLPTQAEVRMLVPGATTLKASRRRILNGQTVRFGGQVRSLPIPVAGKIVELQVYQGRREGWTTFRTLRTDAAGRWRQPYTFSHTVCLDRWRIRARVPKEAGYPFETGGSKTVRITVRGRCDR